MYLFIPLVPQMPFPAPNFVLKVEFSQQGFPTFVIQHGDGYQQLQGSFVDVLPGGGNKGNLFRFCF